MRLERPSATVEWKRHTSALRAMVMTIHHMLSTIPFSGERSGRTVVAWESASFSMYRSSMSVQLGDPTESQVTSLADVRFLLLMHHLHMFPQIGFALDPVFTMHAQPVVSIRDYKPDIQFLRRLHFV